jgi:hypothetical protein
VKDKRGRTLGRTVGAVAGSLAGAARRSQAAAITRVVVYDSGGRPNLLRAGTPEHAAVADPAEKLIAAAREGRPRSRGAAGEDAPEPD